MAMFNCLIGLVGIAFMVCLVEIKLRWIMIWKLLVVSHVLMSFGGWKVE